MSTDNTNNTKEVIPFLLSDERIAEVMGKEFIGFYDYKVACGSARAVRNIYEAARQQDKALIKNLTEEVQELRMLLSDMSFNK